MTDESVAPNTVESGLIVTIDALARRYGSLPSEIINRATTWDLVIMDIAVTLERHHSDSERPGYVPPVSTEELIKIKDSVK